MLQYHFSLGQFWLIKCSFFMHSTTPDIYLKLDSQIEPKFSIAPSVADWSRFTLFDQAYLYEYSRFMHWGSYMSAH